MSIFLLLVGIGVIAIGILGFVKNFFQAEGKDPIELEVFKGILLVATLLPGFILICLGLLD